MVALEFGSPCSPRSALFAHDSNCHDQQRVSPFSHDLDLELVGSIGNFWIVAQLLIVENVLNPILFFTRVSRRSLMEAEVT